MFTYLGLSRIRFGSLLLAAWAAACGSETQIHRDPTEKIIFGDTAPQAYTFMASLQYGFFHYCGATLISRRTLLTAAHCAGERPTRIRLGSRDNQSGGFEILAKDIGDIIAHPGYNPDTAENDIALIRLNIDVPKLYKPIDLAYVDSDELADPNYREETQLMAAGWGVTEPYFYPDTYGETPRFLEEAPFTMLTRTECKERWSWVSPSIVCTHQPDWTNVCNGDSGGPLFRQEGNRFVQIGIASFVFYGCVEGMGGFADVHALRPWIESHFPPRASLNGPIFSGEVACKDGRRQATGEMTLKVQSIKGDAVQATAQWRNQSVTLSGSLRHDALTLWSDNEDLFVYGRFPLEKDRFDGIVLDRSFCRIFSSLGLDAE